MTTDALNLFYPFELNVHKGNINMDTSGNGGDAFKVMLSNTAPTMTWDAYDDISANEVASGNGYTTGGAALTVTSLSQSTGTLTWVLGNDVTWTATGGSMGTFRYAYIYDSTPASASEKWLVGVLDYGSSVTLTVGQSFSIPFTAVTMLTVTE